MERNHNRHLSREGMLEWHLRYSRFWDKRCRNVRVSNGGTDGESTRYLRQLPYLIIFSVDGRDSWVICVSWIYLMEWIRNCNGTIPSNHRLTMSTPLTSCVFKLLNGFKVFSSFTTSVFLLALVQETSLYLHRPSVIEEKIKENKLFLRVR